MAWNEPGGNKPRDPWGNRGGDQGPPDLDEVLENLRKKFTEFCIDERGKPIKKRPTKPELLGAERNRGGAKFGLKFREIWPYFGGLLRYFGIFDGYFRQVSYNLLDSCKRYNCAPTPALLLA